jgi:hypothetical protein
VEKAGNQRDTEDLAEVVEESLSTASITGGDRGSYTHTTLGGGLVFRVSELRKRAKKVVTERKHQNRPLTTYPITELIETRGWSDAFLDILVIFGESFPPRKGESRNWTSFEPV